MKKNIFVFWTGDNEMSPARSACLKTLANSQCEITLVTPENLASWMKDDAPLHPAYQHLSAVHRSDYLRPYFMHHYGGGYADIKETHSSWLPAFDALDATPEAFGIGYREKSAKGVANIHRHRIDGTSYHLDTQTSAFTNYLRYRFYRANWRKMIGMCAYVFRPDTDFTALWLTHVEKRLDLLMPRLSADQAPDPRAAADPTADGPSAPYPVPWSFLCADVIHPLIYRHRDRILQGLPMPNFKNYL
ncbi:hypothetical protein [Labrenzia sp. CE80]|uniref:hypothetical protein n=1 Tax=Labrenzia sp. CE80 TaxID=1788986 RepID=UPI00129B7C69|nr:hypothetical protein [Labrenzia sp. CE80]